MPGAAEGRLALRVPRDFGLAVVAEQVAGHVRVGRLHRRVDHARGAPVPLHADLGPQPVRGGRLGVRPERILEVGPVPRHAAVQREVRAHDPPCRGLHQQLVGANPVAQGRRIHAVGLVGEPAVGTLPVHAPEHHVAVVLVGGGRQQLRAQPEAVRVLELGERVGPPVVVVLPIALVAQDAAAHQQLERPHRARQREVHAAEDGPGGPPPPHGARRIRVAAAQEPGPELRPVGEVARDDVHHAAQGGRAVESAAGSLQHLDALDLRDGEEIPVDAAAVALVGRHAVHQQEDAAAEALGVAG